MRLFASQPAALGTPASLAALMICAGPFGICCVRSTNAVLIESAVALTNDTVPYWVLNSLRIVDESPFGVNVLPLNVERRLKPLRSPATTESAVSYTHLTL